MGPLLRGAALGAWGTLGSFPGVVDGRVGGPALCRSGQLLEHFKLSNCSGLFPDGVEYLDVSCGVRRWSEEDLGLRQSTDMSEC